MDTDIILGPHNPFTGLLAACVATAPPAFAVEVPVEGSLNPIICSGVREIVANPPSMMVGLYKIDVQRHSGNGAIMTASTIEDGVGIMTRLEIIACDSPLTPGGWGMMSTLLKTRLPGAVGWPQWESAIVDKAFTHALRTSPRESAAYQALIDVTTAPTQFANFSRTDLDRPLQRRIDRARRDEVPDWIVDTIICRYNWRMCGSMDNQRFAFWRLVRNYHINVHPIPV